MLVKLKAKILYIFVIVRGYLSVAEIRSELSYFTTDNGQRATNI